MIQKLFAVYDEKADSYGAIICCPSEGLARRSFQEAVNAPNSPIGLYPGDFKLYELGEFDTESGIIIGLKNAKFLANALEYFKTEGSK